MLKYNIIPKPNNYTSKDGTYVISSNTEVLCSPEFVSAGRYLTDYLKTKPVKGEGAIKFQKVAGMENEAYSISVSADGIMIKASSSSGAFYGAVTLKTIIMQAEKTDGRAVINGLYISDKPAFKYRGFMLDECRHFFGTEAVKKLLDNMAMLKLNKFHWHLSDDQGFRIESKLFPKLNEIGSKREYAGLEGLGLKHRGGEYFYYYKQDEIKNIVAYAAKLNIEVIPEIDLPGHASALLAAYPEFACKPREFKPTCENGIFDAAICPGNEDAYDFIDKLFSEICPLFTSTHFHIGGDEASKGHKIWDDCPKCRAAKEKNGLKNSKELQGYYMTRIGEILKKYGKTPIAWNDCINDSFSPDITCQYWLPSNSGEVKRQSYKRDIILSPTAYFYFDCKYSVISLKKVYKYNTVKSGFGKSGQRVIGIEAEMWTEWVDSERALEFSVYPRILALSEVAWTNLENRRYKDFLRRLEWYKTYLRKKGVNYSRVIGKSGISVSKTIYHMGEDGKEFKLSEKRREAEN